jgi:hypothetical protein
MNSAAKQTTLAAVVILLASGCNLVLKAPAAGISPADATETERFVLTAAARTLSALGGVGGQAGGGNRPTATPTLPPTATFTPSITLTPTLEKVTVTVSKNTNCRAGPDINFDLVGIMKVGETAEAIGRNLQKTYWVIKLPSNTTKTCWLWYEWATVTGNGDGLPIIESPPTPTWSPKPDFTFSYIGLTTCPAPKIIRLQIVNTGDIPWESYRVVTTDTVLHTDTTTMSDIFKYYSGCSPLAGVLALGPGETGYGIGVVSNSSSGHNIVVKLTLYTGNGGSGTHMTGDFSFTMP